MDIEGAVNAIRLLITVAGILLPLFPLLKKRRKWIAKVVHRLTRIADNMANETEQKQTPQPQDYLTAATAQNTAIDTLRDLMVMNQESQEEAGRGMRNQMDSLLNRLNQDRHEWRSDILAMKGNVNNLSERLMAVEKLFKQPEVVPNDGQRGSDP